MTKVSETSSNSADLDRSEIAQRAQALEAMARDLVSRLAKGTRDIPTIRESKRATEYSMKGRDIADQVEPTRDLYERVAAILETKPMLFRDLMELLGPGTNENRVKGILVRLQRDGRGVVNLGNGARAIWWIDAKGRLAEIAAAASKRIISPKR